MALCLKCGAVMHDDDTFNHRKNGCNAADIPVKGNPKRIASKDDILPQ